MGGFEIKKMKNKGYMFNLTAGNGSVIATSEGYDTTAQCEEAIEVIRKSIKGAKLEDQTIKGHGIEANPKFEIYKDKAGEFRFRLKDKGGDIVLKSEGYTVKASCKNGISSVIKNAPTSPVKYE